MKFKEYVIESEDEYITTIKQSKRQLKKPFDTIRFEIWSNEDDMLNIKPIAMFNSINPAIKYKKILKAEGRFANAEIYIYDRKNKAIIKR